MIIVSYNVKHFLEQCLYAVGKAMAALEAEVLVVDNASSDGSVEYLEPRFPSVHFITNKHNKGFAKANNQALEIATGKYILFLNPDTIVAEDSFTTCIRFMEIHAEAGACGVHMIDGSGSFLPESKRGFPSPQTSFYKLSGLAALFPRSKQFARYYLGHLSEQQTGEIDVLAGAYFFARRDVLQKTGGFDEAFFMYGEDIDLSYRIQQAGYTNYYLPQTSIIHFKGESTSKQSPQAIRNFYGAMDIFVRKHYKGPATSLFAAFIGLVIRVKLLRGKTNKENAPLAASPVHTLVVGNTQGQMEAAQIISIQKTSDRKVSIAASADLNEALHQQPVQEIIFCEGGECSFQKIICWMQNLSAAYSHKIHAAGSSSIVGSDQKGRQGDVLS